MTADEAKIALKTASVVRYKDIAGRMTAIIYKVNQFGGITVSAEIEDKNRNSITVAKLSELTMEETK